MEVVSSSRVPKSSVTTKNVVGSLNPCSVLITVIIAADQSNARSILIYQTNLDKIAKLSSHSMMGVSGPNCDLVNFTE